MTACSSDVLVHHHGFTPVVVVTGHMTDAPDRPSPRFPERAVPAVEQRIEAVLRGWGVGPGALLVCGGARGGDLLAARVARRLGATVWVLLAHPPEEFVRTSVAGSDPTWEHSFWELLARTPSWVLDTGDAGADPDDVYARVNDWMLDVAERQAGEDRLRLLAVWDGKPAPSAGGAADMVERARTRRGHVEVVTPDSER